MLLGEYLELCQQRHFNWVGWNCVHFTGEWLLHAEQSRAILIRYAKDTETALSAARYVRSMGGLRDAYTAALERDPLPPLAANVGDIVLFDASLSGIGTLGICNGVSAVTLHPSVGLSSTSMAGASCIWKIRNTQHG